MITSQQADFKKSLARTQPVTVLKVLLIEDNPGYAEVIRIMLDNSRDIRFELKSVKRLSEGFDHLSDNGTDLILLDLKLPDSEGIETFDKVCTRAPGVPIIVLTVTDNDMLALEAVQKGAQDYLVKEQVDTKSLVHAIRYAVERKRMERMLLTAAQEWRTTFDAISDIVCLINQDKKIVRCNKAMTKFMRLPFADIIEQSCCELIHGTSVPIEGCPFERMKKTGRTESLVIRRGDRWFNITVDPFLDESGNPLGGVHILTDITKEKEVDHIKSELISKVSHELRTPLSIIKDGIALICDGVLGPLQTDQQEIIIRVKKNSDRLARLINDLLDMSQIDSGRMTLKKSLVNISALVAEVLASFQDQAKNKKIELTTKLSQNILPLYLDRDRISRVFTNLVGNSIKFTPEYGRIIVGIKDNGNEVEVIISDTGIGISADNIPGLFDRFSQFNRFYGPGERGTGLGLPIAREIIEMHGGRIWVESEPKKGSTFSFTLPRGR
jgi:PAS domain S-box-containing protein